jgi:hypothetical protein
MRFGKDGGKSCSTNMKPNGSTGYAIHGSTLESDFTQKPGSQTHLKSAISFVLSTEKQTVCDVPKASKPESQWSNVSKLQGAAK